MKRKNFFLIIVFILGCSSGCSSGCSFAADASFSSPLIPNSSSLVPNADFALDQDHNNLPDSWEHGDPNFSGRGPNFSGLGPNFSGLGPNFSGLEPSRFGWEQFPNTSSKAIWIIGGQDREGEWFCRIKGIAPNTDYILRFLAYRDSFINKIYPEVEIFNQCTLLNNHCTQGGWQIFELHLNSQDAYPVTTLKFKNRFPVKFWFFFPQLVPASEEPPLLSNEEQKVVKGKMEFINNINNINNINRQDNFFPIGIYGISSPQSLSEIKKAGFNTAIIPSEGELVKIASDMEMKVIVNICSGTDDPNHVSSSIISLAASPALLSWYIADEPEISPNIPEALLPLVKKLNHLDPVHPTCVAMNRAWLVSNYQMVNNLFFMDEYPVPNMPLTWFTESLDQARNTIGSQRLWSVVQAFGGPKYQDSGWPRFPTYQEIRALTYLSIIHGATGILYYCYPDAFANKDGWNNLTRVISELNFLYPWLTKPNCTQGKNSPAQGKNGPAQGKNGPVQGKNGPAQGKNSPVQGENDHDLTDLKLRMLSPYKADAAGNPAIHFALKKVDDRLLLLAVNTLDHSVEMSLDGLPKKHRLLNVLFENRKIVVKEGNLQDEFDPFETHIYTYP